ncbi:MAG: tetratricopeptide repeat protein [Planctomycetota bacterium]
MNRTLSRIVTYHSDGGYAGAQRRSGFIRAATTGALFGILILSGTSLLRAVEGDEHFRDAEKALSRHDWNGALSAIEKALAANPEHVEAYRVRGWMQMQRGQYPQAIADFDEAVRLDPDSAETWCNRGLAWARQRDVERAEHDFAEALRLERELVAAWINRAWLRKQHARYTEAAADYAEAIRLKPAQTALRLDRADCLLHLRQFEDALAELSEAIRLEPKEARHWGARGVAQIARGDLAAGGADLRKAISLNPTDAGREYLTKNASGSDASEDSAAPALDKPPTDEALAHGRRQVAAMLKDRPAMAEHGDDAAFLCEWAARRFAGEGFGQLIDWDPTPPLYSDAENIPPNGSDHAKILVDGVYRHGAKRGEPRSFEELWAGAVFELHNVTLAPEFIRLFKLAAAGRLNKEEYVGGIWKAENRAMQQTRAFYACLFLPWAEKVQLTSNPQLWFASHWEDPERSMERFLNPSSYPWKPYARQHDWLTLHLLVHNHRSRQALRLLEQMDSEPGYPEDRAEIKLWQGRCLLQLGRPQEAVAALDAGVGLAPGWAEMYTARAEAHRALGNAEQAAADEAKSRELPQTTEPLDGRHAMPGG